MERSIHLLARAAFVSMAAAVTLSSAWGAENGRAATPASATRAADHQAGMHGRKAASVQLAVGAAFAPDGSLWVVGLDASSALFVRSSPAEQLGRWSAPKQLSLEGDAVSADGENAPKIAFGPQGQVVISYTMPLDKPYTGMIRMLRSGDAGQSFSRPFTVHRDRQPITHRFESIAFDQSGTLHTLWIDKRDTPPKGSGLPYAGAAIYRNESKDAGLTFDADMKLADHSCECCRIALARNAQGGLAAMWRHVFDGHIRDHAFTHLGAGPHPRLSPSSSPPSSPAVVRASFDEWRIEACPHHGPGLALAQADGSRYHAVWFGIRQVDGVAKASVRYGWLDGDGQPIASSVRELPDTRAEHADVIADGSRVAVVWRRLEGPMTELRAWLSRDAGKTFRLETLSRTLTRSDNPRLAQRGDRMVVVWRTEQEIQVHELRP